MLRALLLACMTLLAACASLPQQVERPPSQALDDPSRTALGRAVAAAQPRPGVSGFRLLVTGDDALEARRQLAERAQRTLDLQYYIVNDDAPTRALLAAVRAAADRGVRVRVLIDDMQTEGKDAAFAAFARHRNIELRLFNPFPGQRSSLMTRLLSSLGDLPRLNRRMHNKAFVADNAVGITGGRNLGAEYFLQNEEVNFADLDVLAAGPIVREISKVFDRFWNSEQAYPIAAFVEAARDAPAAPAPRDEPAGEAQPVAAAAATPNVASGPSAAAPPTASGPLPLPAPAQPIPMPGRLGGLTWAPAVLLADAPTKIEFGASEAGDEALILEDLTALMRSARRELLIVTPYFVPGSWGLELFDSLRARGVRVRVLTNSLAATDVPIVHAGYARYRRQLLQMGVELYELHHMPGRPRGWLGLFGSSRASLHAKAMVIDGRVAVISTLNLDPRSIRLNTEMGVVIDSRALSAQVATLFGQSASPENSFRPRLAADGASLEWIGQVGGVQQRLTSEPEAGVWRTLIQRVLGPLAPDALL